MTGNSVFLDTNVIIEIFSGNTRITEQAANHTSFYISAIVLGELYIGINRVQNRTKHLQKLTSFLSLCQIFNVDENTAQIFGEITAELYKKGKSIPTNDIWIAATARQYNFKLITLDKHFAEVNNLTIEAW